MRNAAPHPFIVELGRILINDVEIYSERDYKSHTFEQE